MRITSRLALVFTGAGLGICGTVFLVRAAWEALAVTVGSLWASATIGGGLLFIGIVLICFARNARRRPPTHSPQAAVVAAFLDGLRAGRETAARRG